MSISIGVCAFNEEDRIGTLLQSLVAQEVPAGFEIKEIMVVASGCTDATESIVQGWAATHPEIRLIRESARDGKASALNRILERYAGNLLVLVNADAVLLPQALASLLVPFRGDSSLEIACGCPVPERGSDRLPFLVGESLWGIHNRTLQVLSSLGAANHCCDELMALRRGFIEFLPSGLINDGAYLGAVAARRGLSVLFCPQARVAVRLPRTLYGLVLQRRRILRGHQQVKELLHHPPNTLEELTKRDPRIAASILFREARDRPRSLVLLAFLALPLEIVSTCLVYADRLRDVPGPAAWPVVGRL